MVRAVAYAFGGAWVGFFFGVSGGFDPLLGIGAGLVVGLLYSRTKDPV